MGSIDPRIPPHSIEAELAVLGALLLSPDAIAGVVGSLTPESFYLAGHRKIYTAMVALYNKNKKIDYITVCDQLKSKKQLEEIGGPVFISSLTDYVATAANIDQYVDLVRDRYLKRMMIKAGAGMVKDGYAGELDADQLLSNAETAIYNLKGKQENAEIVQVNEILHDVFDEMEARSNQGGGLTGLATGYTDLDHLTGGLQNSDLIIVAGRPGMGKTSLGLNLAQRIGATVSVMVFTLEMSRSQVVQRFLSTDSTVNLTRIRSGRIRDNEWGYLTATAGRLHSSQIFIDDTPGISVMAVRSKCRMMKHRHNIGLVVIDYLQLMSSGQIKYEGRVQEVSFISRILKELAKELDVPVIALSQINRAVESRKTQIPQLSDLRESGSIEQDADIVMFLYRPEYYEKNDVRPEQEGLAELIIAKQRNGPIGSINLAFLAGTTRFENLN